MDNLIQKASSQAVNFAIRSGITIASGYAFRTLSKFLDKIPDDQKSSLMDLQKEMKSKIDIIVPAIDLIQSLTARGNSQLKSTLELTNELRDDIIKYEEMIDGINDLIENSSTKKHLQQQQLAIIEIQDSSKKLLHRIEDAIPLISLALTTSGANLSSALPDSVSPSRLLQAAKILSTGDEAFEKNKLEKVQIGKEFKVKLYTIFTSIIRDLKFNNHEITWQEQFPRCKVSLWRVREGDNSISRNHLFDGGTRYNYKLLIKEDRNDGRYHSDDEGPLKEINVDVAMVTRLFFSFSGQLLELEESESPVLLLKLNKIFAVENKHRVNVIEDVEQGEEKYFKPTNGVEWIAFEAIQDEEKGKMKHVGEEEDEEEEIEEVDSFSDEDDGDYGKEDLNLSTTSSTTASNSSLNELISETEDLSLDSLQPTLSLLEYLIRLAALQTNDQTSIYDSLDERITLYLREEKGKRDNDAANTSFNSPESPNGQNGSPKSAKSDRFSKSTRSPNTRPLYSPITARSSPRSPKFQFSPITSNRKNKSLLQRVTTQGTPLSTRKSPNATPWEKDRMLRDPTLRRAFNDSAISQSPFREKPKKLEYPESPIRPKRS